MSRSVNRVEAALEAAQVDADVREMSAPTRTAVEAAVAAGCTVDQIAKSILFRGDESGQLYLFITAGGNSVCLQKAGALAGEPLGKADADQVREETGFAIGGVAPIGHLRTPRAFFDPRLRDFDLVWAAAGTPRHIFSISPETLFRISGAESADFVA